MAINIPSACNKLLFECVISSYKLYEKYIMNGSLAEINISGSEKSKLNNFSTADRIFSLLKTE